MPSEYAIDRVQRVVRTSSNGRVTDHDLLGMYQRLRADEGFDAGFHELCDFTGTAAVDITQRALRRLALETPFAHSSRHAIVAPEAVVYGLARMYQAYTEAAGQDRVRVFTDRESACEWLGVGPAAADD
jgi:hypothetical protein